MDRKLFFSLIFGSLLAATAALADGNSSASPASVLWPGRQPDGSMLLHNQWSLRPVGETLELGDFPVNMVLSPDGRYAVVLHCGYGPHNLAVVDLRTHQICSRVMINEAFYGLAISPDGRHVYCSGASDEVVHAFRFDHGSLFADGDYRLRPAEQTGVPSGLTVDSAGQNLYAANLWSSSVTLVNLASHATRDVPLAAGEVRSSLFVPPSGEDLATAAAEKRARAARLAGSDVANGAFPYTCLWDKVRRRFYVSLWADACVAVVDPSQGQVVARWPTGLHPCEMVIDRKGRRLFVANANDNTVTVLDAATGHTEETLWATLFPNSPRGATPDSLVLSPDGEKLFVANANINAVAVFDVSQPGHARCLGFIPTGWYPTCVRVTTDGRCLLILNGKGDDAKPNPGAPQPISGRHRTGSLAQYIGNLYHGTLHFVNLPDKDDWSRQMSEWTAVVLKCTPLRLDRSVTAQRPVDNPIPGRVGDPSPITHCIYIIKENRTYDQVFGDLPQGNGDPALCLFPERVTPNLHELAREFVLLDNFYADAEVSADGHEWSMGAYATDFVVKTWQLNYGHKKTKFPYPSEGVFPVAVPASGYLWDQAARAGVTYRSYGEFVQNALVPGGPATTRLKALQGHFDPEFPSFDLSYSDTNRAALFITELRRFEREGDMPRLQIVRLPNDHTHGVTPGTGTPTSYVADNDLGVGELVDAVSHSRFWTNTAIFVVEDDAQNGPDHVDAHRTEALVISPYTRGGKVDSTLYSTTSMLRTMELILGLQPMTQFDAAATPMYNSFQAQPDSTPYHALPAGTDVRAVNGPLAKNQRDHFIFSREDANDDILFNEVIWRSVRGPNVPMPAPVHAGFVLSQKATGDDDD